jgi:GNAT superfamily N-acetyltransferase
MSAPVRTRTVTMDDAGAVRSLLAELGYALSEEGVRENIRRLADGTMDRTWVAEEAGRILGIVSVHLTPLFHAPGHAGRITSLVVHGPARGRGIGRALVEQAEAFCWRAGCDRLELTTGDHRHDAHRFYERLGYRIQSRRYIKDR